MNDLQRNEIFFKGLIAGIYLYQQKVVTAHKHKEPIKIADELFYLQNGRERLHELLNQICQ